MLQKELFDTGRESLITDTNSALISTESQLHASGSQRISFCNRFGYDGTSPPLEGCVKEWGGGGSK